MAAVLRFTQRYRPQNRAEFMALEAQFAAMERRRADMPKGRRYQPVAGREPTNTLICEFEFASLVEAQAALGKLGQDGEHEALYRRQVPMMEDAYAEILEVLEFSA